MKICYEGIGQWAATFSAQEVSEGDLVKMTANDQVTPCEEDDDFCGVALFCARDGSACTVQLGGMVQLPYSGTAPDVGYVQLVADGDGGVAESDEAGRLHLVVQVDTTQQTLTMVL